MTRAHNALTFSQRIALWSLIETLADKETGYLRMTVRLADDLGLPPELGELWSDELLTHTRVAKWAATKLGFAITPSNVASLYKAHGYNIRRAPPPKPPLTAKQVQEKAMADRIAQLEADLHALTQDTVKMMEHLTRTAPGWSTGGNGKSQ